MAYLREAISSGDIHAVFWGGGGVVIVALDRFFWCPLLAATLSMIVTVTVINLLFWRRLYHLAEERYRME